jgi:hypothetical protein
MSSFTGKWVDSDTIKSFLQYDKVLNPNVFDEEVSLISTVNSQLQFRTVDDLSERVKILWQNAPIYTTLVLNGFATSIIAPYLLKGSIIVASDVLMTTIYVENLDYVIDHSTGEISRATTGGAIADGATVHIWYYAYTLLLSGNDYTMNYSLGQIKRSATTSIPSGGTISIDYSTSQLSIADDLIKESIIQAEAYLKNMLQDSSSTADALVSAATLFTLSLISLAQSSKISSFAENTASERASVCLKTSESYSSKAFIIASPYLKSSSLSSGGVFQNRFSRDRSIARTSPSITPGSRSR